MTSAFHVTAPSARARAAPGDPAAAEPNASTTKAHDPDRRPPCQPSIPLR